MALTDNLVSYWPLDEASGDALDAHGSNDLTETSGTIDSTTGVIGNCRDFELGDTEHFVIADNTDLSTGDIDFTITAWVNLESKGTIENIVAKRNVVSALEYYLRYRNDTDRFDFRVSSNGLVGGVAGISATTLGSPSLATWYFVVAWHDATANTVNIQVNNGTVDSASHSAGVADGTAPFMIGAQNNDGVTASEHFDGLIDEVGFWKRVLTSDERTALYNGGAGLAYPFTAPPAFKPYWARRASQVLGGGVC